MLIRGVSDVQCLLKSTVRECCLMSNVRSIAMRMGSKKIIAVLVHPEGFGIISLEDTYGWPYSLCTLG